VLLPCIGTGEARCTGRHRAFQFSQRECKKGAFLVEYTNSKTLQGRIHMEYHTLLGTTDSLQEMEPIVISSLCTAFQGPADLRKRMGKSSELAVLVTLLVLAKLAGETNFSAAAHWVVLATWVIRSKNSTARRRKIFLPYLQTHEGGCRIRRRRQHPHARTTTLSCDGEDFLWPVFSPLSSG
jgi:hypothetical protein